MKQVEIMNLTCLWKGPKEMIRSGDVAESCAGGRGVGGPWQVVVMEVTSLKPCQVRGEASQEAEGWPRKKLRKRLTKTGQGRRQGQGKFQSS